jgi:hypothetical protein
VSGGRRRAGAALANAAGKLIAQPTGMSSARLAGLLLVGFLIGGCAARYFRDAGPPPAEAPRYSLDRWPYAQYWTGIVFNGARVGFGHVAITPSGEDFEVRGEAAMRFQFLMIGKQIDLLSRDRIGADLTLRDFHYSYNLDGSRLELEGRVEGAELVVDIDAAGGRTEQRLPLDGPVYPSSAIALYPLHAGLVPGRRYEYTVYNGETRTLATVSQEVAGYERSTLFEGAAYRVETRLHGFRATTWMNEKGEPLLERSLNGTLIAHLENERRALQYLTDGALNKSEVLLGFSLIRPETPIETPRDVIQLELALAGMPAEFRVPSGAGQRCGAQAGEVRCLIGAADENAVRTGGQAAEDYLGASLVIPSTHTLIRRQAQIIAGDEVDPATRIERVIAWMQANIAREAVDVFSALDVLGQRRAECQGQSYLYAALARALGIPTRVVNGIVYSAEFDGFLYHTWAESLAGDAWVPVDPTFGQPRADATHVKLVEGERLEDLAPLADLIGRLGVRILNVGYAPGARAPGG